MKRAPLLVAGVLWLGVEASADERTTCATADAAPTVGILVVDYERIPRHIWARAERNVTLMYQSISASTTWRRIYPDAKAPPASPARINEYPFTVVIPTAVRAARNSANENVLGIAPYSVDKRGRLAYVFYDRIVAVARRTGVHPAEILAYVLAHEIGHLLLPVHAHADAGVMRAELDFRTLRPILHRAGLFTPDQRDLIRWSMSCE